MFGDQKKKRDAQNSWTSYINPMAYVRKVMGHEESVKVYSFGSAEISGRTDERLLIMCAKYNNDLAVFQESKGKKGFNWEDYKINFNLPLGRPKLVEDSSGSVTSRRIEQLRRKTRTDGIMWDNPKGLKKYFQPTGLLSWFPVGKTYSVENKRMVIKGSTLMHFICGKKVDLTPSELFTVMHLKEMGAINVFDFCDSMDERGRTPLMLALKNEHFEVISIFFNDVFNWYEGRWGKIQQLVAKAKDLVKDAPVKTKTSFATV